MGEMPPGPIKVTVSDPDTGEVLGERVIEDDYVLICNGRAYLHHTQAHANGTHILTVKKDPLENDGSQDRENLQRKDDSVGTPPQDSTIVAGTQPDGSEVP